MSEENFEEYLHGKCHLVALCALEVTECYVKAVWDLEPLDDDLKVGPTSLVHMYCVLPGGNAFDIRGLRDPNLMEWEIDTGEFGPVVDPDETTHSADHIRDLIKAGVLSDFEEGEREKLIPRITSMLPSMASCKRP